MLIQDARNYPVIITLHNVDENGEEYKEPIHVNAATIAYYYDYEDADGKAGTCVMLTMGRKLLTRESAAEIDSMLLRRLF